MTLILASYLQPWVASLIVAGVLIILVTLCACQGEKDTRYQDYGIPGKLSSIAIDTAPEPTVELRNGRPESIITNGSASSDGKPRTVTERALPDIPRAVQQPSFDTDTDQTPDSGSECYATVTKRGVLVNGIADIGSGTELISHSQPQSPINVSPSREGACSPVSDVSTSQDNPSTVQDQPSGHTYAQVLKSSRHPYARLSAPGDPEPTEVCYQGSPEETEPPLFSAEEASSHGVMIESPSSPAGQAVAGNIPSAEIPYMTPPLATPTQTDNPQLATQKEIPYTVISVREPLERVRMQTRQHMRRRQHSNQGSSLDEPEGYYMEVPDDEQTYAEIDSGQNSGESSSTYDLIEPRGNSDFPPDPPTVESLKSVAKAHSRQASIASVSSFGSGAAGESGCKETATVYSMMDKSKKQNSGATASTDPTVANPSFNLEDLYAKVHKKRVEGTLSVSGIEEVLRMDSHVENSDDVFASARTSWSSTAAGQTYFPPVLPPTYDRFLHVNKALARRHSAEPAYSESGSQPWPEEEPGYAAVQDKTNGVDSDYEQVKSEEPSYARVKRTHKDSDVVDPGYELIKRTPKDNEVEPGYERIQRDHTDSETEPGYELIRRQNFKESFDPGYECVRNLDQSSSDPGYERVPMIGRSGSDVVDPGYESVKRVKRETDRSDPDYECIPFVPLKSECDFTDPGYERVRKLDRSESDVVDPGYERVKYAKHSASSQIDTDLQIPGSLMGNGATRSTSSESGDSVFNVDNPVYEKSNSSENPPSYNDSFICDKISLNVPYSDSVSQENFVSVRVKQSSDSESSVNYSASIVEVECGFKSTRTTNPNELNGLPD